MSNRPDVAIVLFDGDCALCNGCVRWLLKHERRSRYQFAPLQSTAARPWLRAYGLSAADFGSVLAIDGQRLYCKTEAVFHLLREARWYWRLLRVALLIPRPLRDSIYDFVGSHRYRWWGSATYCVIAEPLWRDRLLPETEHPAAITLATPH
ncbi:MAG: DCC1-like thiol-disulfide oxidoreductase family protein [Pseudomonadota bacterium]